MADPANDLQTMFDDRHRYNNFGNVLVQMGVWGFRCHDYTVVEVSSPITAFCGLNGTGKSTLLQLAACAYSGVDSSATPYYVKDFLVTGTLDPAPFSEFASVEYRYWQADSAPKIVTLTRNDETKRWLGYSRRPRRSVLFAGVGIYLPRVEQRDFIIRHASHLTVTGSEAVAKRIHVWTSKVLGYSYDQIDSHTVTHSGHTGQIVSVLRGGSRYSEAHMGYGEGRTQYLIKALETLPEKSLVLIEEPETSLHPSAQYEFGRYLVDVATVRRHQIMLTTHSEAILEALPPKSRLYVSRGESGVDIVVGLTAQQAKSLMSQGHSKALHVLTEDICAQAILTEIIRHVDATFLSSVGIYPAGGADAIALTVRTLKATKLHVAAVRDGDKPATPNENIFKLPGCLPPEKEMFQNENVRACVQQTYGINLSDFETTLHGVNHHRWFALLAEHVHQAQAALVSECARVYARSLPENDVISLVDQLKAAY